jgi:hypothetical protein
MQIIDAKTAVKNRQDGRPYSVWSGAPSAEMKGYGSTVAGNGGARVYTDRLIPDHKPKWKLSEHAAFFAAGSCFAREIELALHNSGVTVQSWTPKLGIGNQLFHRYNTFSIINDFAFAADDTYGERFVYPISDTKYADLTGYGTWPTLDETVAARNTVLARYKTLDEVDVVIITLGLVEAWYDRQNETYLNVSPFQLVSKCPDRFELRVTNYVENLDATMKLMKYIHSQWPNIKIILTVSPVPFSDTFSGADVVVANTYSKAVLRSVAHDVVTELDYVDYFPSYEIVMLSNPGLAWLPDRRHVPREHVEHIVTMFRSFYFGENR